MRCAECGGELVSVCTPLEEEIRGERYTVYGITRYECQKCHEYEIDASEEERLSAELWRQYRQRHGMLSPHEIRGLREARHLSQAEFGKLVGANIQTVSRWENGRVIQDERANRLMVLMRDVPAAFVYLCELSEVHPGTDSQFVTAGWSVDQGMTPLHDRRTFSHALPVVTFGSRRPCVSLGTDGDARCTTSLRESSNGSKQTVR